MDFKVTFDSEEVEALIIKAARNRFGDPPAGMKYYAEVDRYGGGAEVGTIPDDPPPVPALVEEAVVEKGADDGN